MKSIETIASSANPHVRQAVQLDGRTYLFTISWNGRRGLWSMTISDSADAPIVAGAFLAEGSTPLAGCVDARRPPGEIVIVTSSGVGLDAFAEGEAKIVYVAPGELP